MSADTIYNAAPEVINLGTQDLSTEQLPIEPETVPQHCPKFFLWTQKGPTVSQLVSSAHANQLYGSNSFDIRKKYANYATVMYNNIAALGNKCMLHRLQPPDAGPAANLTLWLDVLPVTVNITERNSDGSIMVNSSGNPVTTGQTAPGYKVKWVVTNSSSQEYTIGEQTITTGEMVSTGGSITPNASDYIQGSNSAPTSSASPGSTVSTRYPILEIQASSFGEWGNNVGIQIFAGTQNSLNYPIPTAILQQNRVYPYFFQIQQRPNNLSSPSVAPTILGSNNLLFTFQQNQINPLTDGNLYLGDIFVNSYNNTTNPTFPRVYGAYDNIYIYNDNIATLLNMFYQAEIPFINQFSDFTGDPADVGLFNFVSGVSSQNVPYQTYIFVDDWDSVSLNPNNILYTGGSSDGTLNDTVYAQLVTEQLQRYANPNDPIQDLATNVESIIYDPGFPLPTKQAMADVIAIRPDTMIAWSTYVCNSPIPNADEEYSTALALLTQAQMYPESEYFGTPVMRAIIIGRCGNLVNSQYTKTVPLTHELAMKAARYMGASNGKWKPGANFDGAPGSIINSMNNVNITFVPPAAKNIDWSVGLNWVQAYDRRSLFFPAFKTVYTNDTSVLTSFITVMGICTINKIMHEAWRNYSGESYLTNAQLIDRVNAFITNATNGIFDSRFVVVPNTYISDMDAIRGYSWHIQVQLYADNMKTVAVTYVTSYRMSSLTASAATGAVAG
jgi:hypothetical protein